ncbi:MAG: MotA/TolQ/ExbB proton channel family protein [Methanobacterium paludis]|uniref:MotA/TolQ/ExbB proton channel n=1 Tax=Methanobacterium paludis (strain DSM 25820 / JCM 18151 / SWAN1) TaxID=868131 RepID=F6D7M4_METPW|nr:MotA/TolQ/ExbB proton channel family protein [Methanobacterium paludis]AEG17103.1 MotA/TolQ/ExbB proton channel [Methanobacterium paludis]MCE7699325.1 MotA/TolQ/ExbB proton channel family protein [Methanobacterium paludis]
MTASVSSTFSSGMHAISQSLLVPVMVVLTIFFLYALLNLGILMAEYYKRRKVNFNLNKFVNQLLSLKNKKDSNEIIGIIEAGNIPKTHKEALKTLINSSNVSDEFRESLALKMVEDESLLASKKLEKTDIIAKISPAVGLMGTLIPLGPGLTALGAGNIQDLAQHLTMAFDAAVLGMAAAAIAFLTSKIRRRWYEEEISDLETLMDTILEIYKC